MKHLLTLSVLFMLGVVATWADDFNLYYISTGETNHVKIAAVSDIQKLTFEGNQMNVVTKSGTTTAISVTNLQRLFISTDNTVAIKEVKPQQEKGQQETVVYDLMGRRVQAAPDQLAKGIYIINNKKVSIK